MFVTQYVANLELHEAILNVWICKTKHPNDMILHINVQFLAKDLIKLTIKHTYNLWTKTGHIFLTKIFCSVSNLTVHVFVLTFFAGYTKR